VKIRRTVGILLTVAVLLTACRDRQPTDHRTSSRGSTGTVAIPRSDPPLAKWLRRVPADARWAVVSADLDRLRAVLSDTAALLGHHSRIAPTLLAWQSHLKRLWGLWPLATDGWTRLNLQPGSGGLLYRHASGATVLAFRTVRLGKTLETIQQAIRHRGKRKVGPVKQLQIAGKPAFGLERWTCATRERVSWCADVEPARFDSVIRARARNLWSETLGRVDGQYPRERLGIWLGPPPKDLGKRKLKSGPGQGQGPGPGPGLRIALSLYRAARTLLGWTPRGLWLTTSLGRRLQLHGLAISPPGQPVRPPSPLLPKPGQSGLAAAGAAPLVLRLRMKPRHLEDHLQRLIPALGSALALVRGQRVRGETLTEEMLNGEVVLLSDHAGVAAILGLRSRARGLRAMKRLMLLLGPRIGDWQKRVRDRGRGWDLSLVRSSLVDSSTHRLTLKVPHGAGAGAPKLRDGRMTLLWGVAQRHLVVATDPNLFRRILARVEQPDARFLRQLGDAMGRRGFKDHHPVAAYLRPDDPLYTLPKAQREAAHRWLADLAPSARHTTHWIRALIDLTDSATLACEQLRVGVGCHLSISLMTKPGPGPGPGMKPSPNHQPILELDAKYREALIKKWGGNRDGHLRGLRSLAQLPAPSPLGAKASRILANRQGVPHSGLEGLLVSVWLPWARHRLVIAARQEAPRELHRLAQAVRNLARRAQKLPAAARRRWYRKLVSTRITPLHSCCAGGVRRCESRAKDWSHPTWRRLKFSLSGSHLYRYQLILEPGSLRQRLVLRALGDLNCNGRSSILQRVGTIDGSSGALEIGPLIKLRPDN
jgi:hypothetical protein